MSADALSDFTSDLLCLADVHRWNVVKTLRQQSVAEHSFAVAVIAKEICIRLGQVDDAFVSDVLWQSLTHDRPEILTGDIDGKFKRDYPEVKVAVDKAEKQAFGRGFMVDSPTVSAVVKLADRIEGLSWIITWGRGVRADDVRRELLTIIHSETVPMVAKALNVDEEVIVAITRQILNHSVSESNCIQLRRHRQ